MQGRTLPGHVIRNGRAASRLIEAKTPDIAAEIRRNAVARWRGAMRRGLSAVDAARAVGVARATLYRWEKRAEFRSRRARRPNWSSALVPAVEGLRLDNPMWGRAKLGPLVRAEGFEVGDATVGRILARLVARGVVEAVPITRKAAKTCRWTAASRFARRLPKGLKPEEPGDIVQIDTVFVQIAPECHVKHFTAYDPVAKWTVGGVARRASATTTLFLDKVLAQMSFPVKAIQVDGGCEFKAEFEAACGAKGITLYELPPRRPQLNGAVERCNGAWLYEFYAVNELPTRIDQLAPFVDAFQQRYNHHRPHGALGGRTPASYLKTRTGGPPASHMS